MELNIEEAFRAKEHAEKLFMVNDYMGAKQYAIKAQALCPQLEGVSQMVATFEIYAAAQTKINGEIDLYSVLGLGPSAEKSVLKKQYRKMAVLLHPDKNKTMGADEAFKLVSEAWSVLSDNTKRNNYDVRRNKQLSASVSRLDTFWTVCTTCRVQYEYLRKYVNKRLSCKNCRGVFVAVETGSAPVTYCPWSYTSENNGYANHSYNTNATTYIPNSSVCFTGNGSSTYPPAHTSEYGSNATFQWNTSTGASDHSVVHKRNKRPQSQVGPGEIKVVKLGRPRKKRKIEPGNGTQPTNGEMLFKTEPDVAASNGHIVNETSVKWYPAPPTIDIRKLLIDKARSVIRVKLEEIKLASKNEKAMKKTDPVPITVPDPDFHDFDRDRLEEVFKPKQIWAIYDEEDGMPRLYCLIREVISVKPFQLYISYLNSKTDTEFGCVKWIESGFTKSCGNFRVFHSDIVDQVNIFSHLLGREKAGRGGCVKIYPKSGDVWAVYRNWSVNWNRKTPEEVRHQYEMVEILEDYSEELGIRVTPLVKLNGYKTVYQRDEKKNGTRWIPRREMVRFSHQVPSCLLKGQGLNLPDGCWDLDPAATPEELLQAAVDEEKQDLNVQSTNINM
ncbi:DnaJ domain-containing protein [Artemisia annua]|uniref:DnaJ domain-containing protein n=1 Tax=Artemisia annua TaxID=35608 RepID=A0A2U1M065_ARTAN|nr:DnaJ domain-containing protein [Artemisia annua]